MARSAEEGRRLVGEYGGTARPANLRRDPPGAEHQEHG